MRRLHPPVLAPGDTHIDALQMMVAHGLDEAVELASGNGTEAAPDGHETDAIRAVAGLLKRSELQSFYQQRLLARELLG